MRPCSRCQHSFATNVSRQPVGPRSARSPRCASLPAPAIASPHSLCVGLVSFFTNLKNLVHLLICHCAASTVGPPRTRGYWLDEFAALVRRARVRATFLFLFLLLPLDMQRIFSRPLLISRRARLTSIYLLHAQRRHRHALYRRRRADKFVLHWSRGRRRRGSHLGKRPSCAYQGQVAIILHCRLG